jgi:hypothetical protein
MKMHKRERVVNQARIDLSQAILDWAGEHKLTDGEYVSVLNGVLSDQIGSWAKYKIREERHGNTDTPGGLDR